MLSGSHFKKEIGVKALSLEATTAKIVEGTAIKASKEIFPKN